jgi:protein-tyrosine kinase
MVYKGASQLSYLEEPKASSVSVFQQIHTNIHYTRMNGKMNSLMVTSANPGEGKSTIASSIAVAMAQSGKKVLLVDGDLRKPAIHNIFELSNQWGLTSLLVDQARIEACIHPILFQPGLFVLPSGPTSPNPTELLESEELQVLFVQLKEEFDTIVFDSPSVLAYSDSLLLAKLTEGIIIVMRSGKVHQEQALKAKGLIEQTGANLIGAVLNDKKWRRKNRPN